MREIKVNRQGNQQLRDYDAIQTLTKRFEKLKLIENRNKEDAQTTMRGYRENERGNMK